MSAALDFALEEETRRTRAYGDWSRAAVVRGDPGVSVLTATQSATAVLGQLGRSPAMTNHAEQLRHNTGLVWNCVRAISQRMAGQPIRLARKLKAGQTAAKAFRPHKDYLPGYLKNTHAGLEVIPSHLVLDAIERPNQLMVRWSLVAITGMHLECCGRSFWWIFKNPPKSPRPYTVMPLPPSWVEPVHKVDRLYAEWKVTPGNSSQTFTVPGEEIVQLYYPDPENPLAALSPLQKIAKSILADESITEAQRRSFSNGIWPGLAITMSRNTDVNGQQGNRPRLTPAQRKQLIAPILQAYRGVINFDEPIILDGTIEAVQRISQSPREMEFLKSHQITKERITQGFGVNPIVTGQIQDANRASAAAADDHFCFPPGEPVQTKRGFVPIEEVLPGDEVWTGKGRWRPVEESLRRAYRGKMTRLHMATPNWPLDLTPDHPLWVRTAAGTVGWVAAGKVKRGDLVCLPRGQDEPPESFLEVSEHVLVKAKADAAGRVLLEGQLWSKHGLPSRVLITEEMAWAFGLYLAEGHTSTSQVVWSIHKDELADVTAAVDSFALVWGLSASAWTANGENGVQVRLSSTALGRLLDRMFGRGAAGKRVPAEVYGWPVQLREKFLAGYFYGDGSVARQNVSYCSVSLSIAAGVRTLLASLGIPCGLSRYEGRGEHFIQGRLVRTSNVYYIGRIGAESGRVLEWMGLASIKEPGRGRRYQVDDDAVWFPVHAVETSRYRGWVYNLRVSEDHSYTTATCVASNCSTCVNPKLELLSQYFTAWLLPVFGLADDYVLYFEPAHSTDPDFELKRHQTLVDRGAETIGEFRAENGLTEKPGGNLAIRLNSYTAVNLDEEYDFDEEPQPPPPAVPGTDQGQDQADEGDGGNLPGELGGGDNQGSGRGTGRTGGTRRVAGLLEYREAHAHLAGTLDPARLVQLWGKAQGKAEAALAAGLRHYFARVAKEAASGVGLGSGTARELTRRCFSPRAWDRDLKDAVRPRLRQITDQGAKRELLLHRPRKASELGDVAACLKAGRLTVPPDVRREMGAFVKAALTKPYWKGINDQIRDDLEAAFQKAIDAGKSGKELADTVQTVLGPVASKSRATRIARTEATGFMNAGQQASRKKLAALGAVTGKQWAALPGKRTRETHEEADGQTVAVEEAFTVGGYECQYPGDLDLPPEERVCCRCASLSTTAPLAAPKAWALAEIFCLWEA